MAAETPEELTDGSEAPSVLKPTVRETLPPCETVAVPGQDVTAASADGLCATRIAAATSNNMAAITIG
jgi:hypothetical protein